MNDHLSEDLYQAITVKNDLQLPTPGAKSTGIMLSTLWNQSGTIDLAGNRTITYNEYCPNDPKGKKSVTGCTNTAAAQIIYYYIEKKGLNLTLTLDKNDEYTSYGDNGNIGIYSNGSTSGTVSFSSINSMLEDYDIYSAQDAAALIYACGVVQQANYASNGTGTPWTEELFYRSGFESVISNYVYDSSTSYHPMFTIENGQTVITDAGYEVIIENLQAGRVVGTSCMNPHHAMVIDGYDAENDLFHVNYGWGNSNSTAWYSREDFKDDEYYHMVYDLYVVAPDTVTVSDTDVYGTGTLYRAFEQAAAADKLTTVKFNSSLAKKDIIMPYSISLSKETVVDKLNVDLIFENKANGFVASDAENITFKNTTGALVNNGKNISGGSTVFYTYGESQELSLGFSGGITYIGSYHVDKDYYAGTQEMLSSFRESQRTKSAINQKYVDSSIGYAVYSTSADDTVSLIGKAIVAGDVYLNGGQDTITVDNFSQLYGDISAVENITIDCTSCITGMIFGATNLEFSLEDTHRGNALFTITSNVYNIYNNATITVDAACATDGNYTLISAQSDASNKSYLNNITFSVTEDGKNYISIKAGESKKIDGTSYKISRSGNDLVLTVTDSKNVAADTNLKHNGASQIVGWDTTGKVGYVNNDGENKRPKWQGIWEWSGSDASKWRVDAVGHFKGTSVDYDGILLYNKSNTTFAAWTNLETGSYGYVSLCHVASDFSTVSLGNFDNDEYDDILICNSSGSFGVVLDGTTYKDIWHVTGKNYNEVIGAGYFNTADHCDSLVVRDTRSNTFSIWINNDPTFNTWNWSSNNIITLGDEWEVAGIGDFEGDGVDDIMFLNLDNGELWVLDDGLAENKLRWRGTLENTDDWEVAAVGDYNGNGTDDILLRELKTGWGGLGYWDSGYAGNWVDLHARVETGKKNSFEIIA